MVWLSPWWMNHGSPARFTMATPSLRFMLFQEFGLATWGSWTCCWAKEKHDCSYTETAPKCVCVHPQDRPIRTWPALFLLNTDVCNQQIRKFQATNNFWGHLLPEINWEGNFLMLHEMWQHATGNRRLETNDNLDSSNFITGLARQNHTFHRLLLQRKHTGLTMAGSAGFSSPVPNPPYDKAWGVTFHAACWTTPLRREPRISHWVDFPLIFQLVVCHLPAATMTPMYRSCAWNVTW